MTNTLVTQLNTALHSIVADARLTISSLPKLSLQLWLIDPSTMQRQFSPQETQRLLHEPPYWCFCWASIERQLSWPVQRQLPWPVDADIST